MNDITAVFYRLEPDCYCARRLGVWYELVRDEGACVIEPDDGLDVAEYMSYVLMDAEEVMPGDVPAWAFLCLDDMLS